MPSPIKIGVVGFSRNAFDKQKAYEFLDQEFSKLAAKYTDPSTVEIVSGYTKMGVPEIAYTLADKYGFRKVGFSARQALRVKCGLCQVDKEILIGERFGDESQDFVKYINGLIRIGGGPQSQKEVDLFKVRNRHLPLERILKEYEVEWYGKTPGLEKPAAVASQQASFFEEVVSETYEKIYLDKTNWIGLYRNIKAFQLKPVAFENLWNEHPAQFHEVMMHGKLVKTPRWQQAYGKNYEYTGSKNNALPLQAHHQSYVEWAKKNADPRINGLLINWYDGRQKHYIGKHRDSTKGLMPDSPIVTISHGGTRLFRLRPYGGTGFTDFEFHNGDAIVIPAATNQYFTHEVPHHTKFLDNRISVTLRAYH